MAKDQGNKKPAPKIGGLAAALVQAGHLSENRARNLAREERKTERTVGRKAVEATEAEKRQQADAARRARAEEDRARAAALSDAERHERIRKLVDAHRVPATEAGRLRWFFVARDGRVPFLAVSDGLARGIEQGEVGIVDAGFEDRSEHVAVVGRQALAGIGTLEPDRIRFWNR